MFKWIQIKKINFPRFFNNEILVSSYALCKYSEVQLVWKIIRRNGTGRKLCLKIFFFFLILMFGRLLGNFPLKFSKF